MLLVYDNKHVECINVPKRSTTKKEPPTLLSKQDREELGTWLSVNCESLPSCVRIALEQHAALLEGLEGTQRKLREVLSEIRRALGITPSSEKRSSGRPLGPLSNGDGKRPKDKRAQLEVQINRFEKLASWHSRLGRSHRKKAKDFHTKLMKLEEIELTIEEMAEVKEEDRKRTERLQLGDGPDTSLQSASESFMTGVSATMTETTAVAEAQVDTSGGAEVVDTITEQRERFDFSFSISRVTVDVEKKVVKESDGSRHIVSASTDAFGPPRYAVTWGLLANNAVLVVQYAMPMSRLAKLMTTEHKRFTAGYLARLLRYTAHRFLPVYLELSDSLAYAAILLGDDTSSRVLEVHRYFKSEQQELPPWRQYGTVEEAMKALEGGDSSLGARIGSELGFEFQRRDGKGAKTTLQTTTVSGRSVAQDPSSLIVLYRTHLGGFGNLLEMLLEKRHKSLRQLTVQSDLSPVNLVVDHKLCELFDIRYAGCASHARRPFALYEHEDPDLCAHMLHLFKGLFLYEYGLDLYGRNPKNVSAVRDVDSRELWRQIKELAEDCAQRWSPKTKLGDGARYILRNFNKLTAYLEDYRLNPSNNASERNLRIEKLIQASSMFRTSLEGRFALDIMRSVIQTAIAAGVPIQDYLLDVLRTAPEQVNATPELFTPRAWAATRSIG